MIVVRLAAVAVARQVKQLLARAPRCSRAGSRDAGRLAASISRLRRSPESDFSHSVCTSTARRNAATPASRSTMAS